MNAAMHPPGLLELIQSELEPEETLLEVCKFNMLTIPGRNKNRTPVVAVLTNRYFHFMAVRKMSGGKWKLRAHSQLPLSSVSAVTTKMKRNSAQISLFWEGREESLVAGSKWFEEAKAFASQSKRVVTEREVRHEASGVADEIAKLSQLANEGILTEDELARAKDLMLGRPSSDIDQSIVLLKNLHELQRQGVLSESEFNMKKWDVLSKKDFQ